MGIEEVYQRNLHHKVHKAGWLRAAVLGANDGLVSIASLLIGVAAAKAQNHFAAIGLAGIAAGAMSMAVGEFISVRSQSDIEESDRIMEMEHLLADPDGELEELTQIYRERGLTDSLAAEVAKALTEHNALETHLRDELGQFEHTKARPVQAGVASAISFTIGGVIPFIGAVVPIAGHKSASILFFGALGLIGTGVISARLSGSPLGRTTARVLIGGAIGTAITAGIGALVHASGA